MSGINQTTGSILKNAGIAALGLFFFSFGDYLTIQANIGVSPWDTLHLGLAGTLGLPYGTANILISVLIVGIDILMHEMIGIGMLLDAFLVGKYIDLLNWIGLIPKQTAILPSLLFFAAGLAIIGFSQAFYMRAALGCGPRDSLLIGLKRRLPRVPIGLVSITMLGCATLIGWILGGPVGIGTLASALLTGPVMQLEFHLIRFDPTGIRHQSLLGSWRVITRKKS